MSAGDGGEMLLWKVDMGQLTGDDTHWGRTILRCAHCSHSPLANAFSTWLQIEADLLQSEPSNLAGLLLCHAGCDMVCGPHLHPRWRNLSTKATGGNGVQGAHGRRAGCGVGARRHCAGERRHREHQRGVGRGVGPRRAAAGGPPPLCAGCLLGPRQQVYCHPVLRPHLPVGLAHLNRSTRSMSSFACFPLGQFGMCIAYYYNLGLIG